MKPEWSEAPEWASYLAMDADGEWVWFESIPDKKDMQWWPRKSTKSTHAGAELVTWDISLEGRPNE